MAQAGANRVASIHPVFRRVTGVVRHRQTPIPAPKVLKPTEYEVDITLDVELVSWLCNNCEIRHLMLSLCSTGSCKLLGLPSGRRQGIHLHFYQRTACAVSTLVIDN